MKKRLRKVLSRALTVAFIFLFVFSVVVTQILHTYDVQVNDFLGITTSQTQGSAGKVYYPTAYEDVEEEFQAKSALVREIVSEGTVLLKNENEALPVSEGNVAVYFPDITHGYTPEVNGGVFFTVDGQDIYNGEESFVYATNHPGASYKDNSSAFTGDYTTETSTSLTEALAYDGLNVTKVLVPAEGDVAPATNCSTAFVVFGRVAGERADLDYENKVLQLDARELKTLNLAKASGADKIVVILSGDHVIEAASLKSDPDIDAIIKVGNVGYRGAYGLADVITGKKAPSGKLVDTYAAKVDSAPAMQNFGNYLWTNADQIKTSEADAYVANLEGIYVDYKYYETRYADVVAEQGNANSTVGVMASTGAWNYAEEVVYSYGYGLSYTTFEQELVGAPVIDKATRIATVTVKVTNTGSVDGKDVVAIYGQAPYTHGTTKIEKSAIQLVGFEKTDVIKAGESVEIEVPVHLQWLASFDYLTAGTYVMEGGDHYLALGNGAHEALNNILAKQGVAEEKLIKTAATDVIDADKVCVLTEGDFSDIDWSKSTYNNEVSVEARFEDSDINYWYGTGANPMPYTYLSRSDWAGTYPSELTLAATQEMLDYLNNTDRFFGKVDDTYARAEENAVDGIQYNTATRVTEPLAQILDMMGKDYDDPGWEKILNSLTAKEMSDLINKGAKVINATVSVNFPGAEGTDNPIGLNVGMKWEKINNETGEKTKLSKGEYLVTDGISDKKVDLNKLTSTMYASVPTLAATFNQALAYEQGEMMGEDGLYSDQEWNWGLGANFHRSPYCGRLSEYFSADAVHSSLMGAAEAQGAWDKGHVLVAKHFVTNDQESNRQGVVTFINEQAFRENQLRAFEGIMTYGECKGVMTTYNRLGLIGSTAAEYDLMTEVLRNEWATHCYVITDLCGHTPGLYEGNTMLTAGTDIMLAAGTHSTLTAAKITEDKVLLNAARRACHNLLYVYVHTAAMNAASTESKVVLITPWWETLCTTLEYACGSIAILSACWYLFEFNFEKKGVKKR